MAVFSVLILTAAPAGQAAEGGGAFVRIDGREALLRSVELFLNRDNIKQIQICFAPDEVEEAKRKYGAHLGFSGVKVISGGPRWVDQAAVGAQKVAAESTHVVVHDAARPIVPYSDVDALLEAAEKSPAAALATPARGAMLELDEAGGPVAVALASRWMHLQTPQAFEKERFLAMAAKKEEPHASTLSIVKGSPLNVRLGGPGDERLAKALIAMLPKPKMKAASPFEEAQW